MWTPTPYCIFFNNNVCHVCKTFEKPLKRCSSCKTMVYCGPEHQKVDWKLHKELCLAIKKSNTIYQTKVNTMEDLIEMQFQKQLYWKKKLNRDLYEYEIQMWMYPRYCTVCFSQEVITACEKCHNIYYCSEEHKKSHESQHNKYCDALKLSLRMDISLFQDGPLDSLDVVPVNIPDSIVALPENLKALISLYDEVYSQRDELWGIRVTDFLAPAATILYGLEAGGFLHNRVFSKEELVVHLVGADIAELGFLWKFMFELPFHWVKNLKNFEYIMIGPDLKHNGTTDKFTEHLCDTCKSNKVTKFSFHTQLYHTVVENLKKPDVVVAFNSGLHEFSNKPRDTWKETIPFLCKNPGVPLILTAYTEEEIIADLNLVKSAVENVRVIVEHRRNPFSNMKPLKNFTSNTQPIYYINGYIAVLMKN